MEEKGVAKYGAAPPEICDFLRILNILGLTNGPPICKHVDGIPSLPFSTPVDGCDMCWACKMHKAACGSSDTRADATVLGQGISLDWGFMAQCSKDEECYESLVGIINGKSLYILIADHHSDKLLGITSNSKESPMMWLNRWLVQYKPPDCDAKYASMDLRGEHAKNTKVCDLLDHRGYAIRPTAPDASWHYALGERPHQTIGNTLRSMFQCQS